MTLLEGLQSHRGGLLHIKSELYWYGGRGFDGAPGRVCLILDAAAHVPHVAAAAYVARRLPPAGPFAVGDFVPAGLRVAALLLIDGCPHWVWVAQEDVELIT